ncbi:DUF7288 family protein [Halorussus halobius]|uniref:DUF7288 family protein n=1 Tax=Halorussus halobius TaxID=1710537 RepID=UPI001092C633|nr:hypothetical protein [Halorussus halobius]
MVGDDRGQAFALEGIVGSIVVLTAVLFALEAVVLTPTTAGTVDQDVKAQLRVEADDALTVAAEDDQLRSLALYWNNSSRTFAHADDRVRGYGSDPPCTAGPPDADPPCESVGELLNDTLSSQGYEYNLYVDYRNDSAPFRTETERVVYRGVPSDNAVTATHAVVLYDDDRLTSSEAAGGATLAEIDADPDRHFYAGDADPGPAFTVAEVRLVVW